MEQSGNLTYKNKKNVGAIAYLFLILGNSINVKTGVMTLEEAVGENVDCVSPLYSICNSPYRINKLMNISAPQLEDLKERVALLEYKMNLIESTSKDNNDRLKKIERIFWLILGLVGGNLAGALAILERLK